jgi:hypothetical protein
MNSRSVGKTTFLDNSSLAISSEDRAILKEWIGKDKIHTKLLMKGTTHGFNQHTFQ